MEPGIRAVALKEWRRPRVMPRLPFSHAEPSVSIVRRVMPLARHWRRSAGVGRDSPASSVAGSVERERAVGVRGGRLLFSIADSGREELSNDALKLTRPGFARSLAA